MLTTELQTECGHIMLSLDIIRQVTADVCLMCAGDAFVSGKSLM